MANWWEAGGATGCVAAYDAIGAASLAASYTDLSGSGNDAAPGVAPTWAAGTGWTFDGATQYLDTGVVGAAGYTVLVRFSGATSGAKAMMAAADSDGSRGLGLWPRIDDGVNWSDELLIANPNLRSADAGPGSGAAAGVLAAAGESMYLDGSLVASSQDYARSYNTTMTAYIGAINWIGTPLSFWPGNIQAVAIHSGTLDASEIAAVTAAMQALPAASGSALPLILQAHHEAGWL